MKYFNKYYLIVIGLSVVPIISIYASSQMPHLHDGVVHLARMGAYFKALQDFQIPVRWAGDLNYGYGMPIFNFIYHVPYLLSSLFLFLGFGLVNSFKIVLSLSFLLSGIFMFAFAKELFKDNTKAILVTVFYQFAPFRLVEIMVRGSFGEVYAYTFFPLVLFGLVKIFKKKESFWIILTAVATALLVLSHNALSLTFFSIAVLFVFFFGKTASNVVRTKEKVRRSITGLFLGLMLSSFYWIPAIFEHRFTYGDLFMKDLFRSHFPSIQNFFIPNFFNDPKFQTGGISTQIGLFHEIAILLGIVGAFIKNKKTVIASKAKPGTRRYLAKQSHEIATPRHGGARDDRKLIIFNLLIFFVALFFMQPISIFIWENVSFLRQFQFSWRFLGVVAFATSLLSVTFLSFKLFQKKWIFALLVFLVIFSTIYYWKPPLGFDSVDERYYWNYPLNTTYFGETDVVWSGGPAISYPKQRVEVIGGTADVKNFKKKSNLHTFMVDAQSEAQLVDHTQYFPGWRVLVDDKEVEVEFQDPNNRGEITFWVPEGEHKVKVVFGESPVRFAADLISGSTFLGLLAFSILKLRRAI